MIQEQAALCEAMYFQSLECEEKKHMETIARIPWKKWTD